MIAFLYYFQESQELIEQSIASIMEEEIPFEVLVEPDRKHLEYSERTQYDRVRTGNNLYISLRKKMDELRTHNGFLDRWS